MIYKLQNGSDALSLPLHINISAMSLEYITNAKATCRSILFQGSKYLTA